MNKKNKENLLEWADVLESGKYEQIHGAWGGSSFNEGKGGYCCLNVALCHFTGKEYDANESASDSLWQLFGLDFSMDNYYKMNDRFMYNFPQIATEIRKSVSLVKVLTP